MNIAIFSDSYLPTKSGIVTVVVQLREQLLKLGHKVVLVTVETTPEYATNESDIYRVKSKPLGLGTDQFFSMPNTKEVIEYIRSKNIDVIHCHTEFGVGRVGIKVAKKLKLLAICTTHTMWILFYKHYLPMAKFISGWAINMVFNSFYKKFDCLIGVSTKARNYFKKFNSLKAQPSVVIPNAIDRLKFGVNKITDQEKLALRNTYGFSNDDKVMLFVGRVGEEKRTLELLEVCKKVVKANPHFKMIFVGAGPALEQMQSAAQKEIANGQIVFAGFIEWTKLSAFYESADVFVTCSLSEMHSMTILEAQLSGLPIVVRKDESYFDCVFDGVNGYLTDTEDEMAIKLIELLNDDVKLKEFSKNSLQITQKFTIEAYIKKTLLVYEEVIKAYPNKIDDEKLNAIMEDVR